MDRKKYDRWKKKRDVILFLFAFIEVLIIFIWPTVSCLNICEPDYGTGFYYGIITLPYIALYLVVTYFIFFAFEAKKMQRFFVITKAKVIFFTIMNLLFVSLTEAYLRTLTYVGRVDTIVVDGNDLISFLYLPSWFTVLMLSLLVSVPVLLYFLSCFVFYKAKRR